MISMRVAYFTNSYPKVSHSFIRRELLAVEALGVEIRRYALRGDAADVVDAADRAEAGLTRYVLSMPAAQIFSSVVTALGRQPARFVRAFTAALRMGWRSDRGLLRHVAYFFEACVIRAWCDRDGIDHMHVHFGTNPAAIACLARLLGGPPYSFTVHGPEEFDKPEFLSLRTKINGAQFVVAISSFGRSQLYRWLPVADWPKVQVVRCGLAEDFLAHAPVPSGSAHRFVCVGRLCEQKGQLLLVRAVAALAAAGEPIELVFAGDGPLRRELEREIAQGKLQNRVRITGWLDAAAVRAELLQARAMVLPSFAEGLPVVVMEALALERPVISTYVAGIPELVQNRQNGWLVPAGCMDSLIDAMREALHMPETRMRAMGKAGRERVLEYHDVQREAAKLVELFSAGEQRPVAEGPCG